MTTTPLGSGAKLPVTVPHESFLKLWAPAEAPADMRVWDVIGQPPIDPVFVVTPYAESEARLEWLTELPGLEVIQSLSAGVDLVLPYVATGVTLCNAAGVHEAGTAELAVGLALAALRGIGQYTREEIAVGPWPPPFRPSLADRRVLIIGSGRIGRALAQRLKPFEVSICRVASHAREDEDGHVHEPNDIPSLLPSHDVVFLTLPLNPYTRHMVNRTFLAAMPDGALLVNVGRGAVVDTTALIAETLSGRLLAALDVTDPEPLPYDHPLWEIPGVLITPHVGGASTSFLPRARTLIREQIERMATGLLLHNVVIGPQSRHCARQSWELRRVNES